jgi:HTH-type transcriptional regulator/antitoxin HipB
MLVRTPEELGQLIRERRRELGLDQRSLAERVGVSRLWIIEFEKGKPRAEIGLVLRTLNALELSLDVASDVERSSAQAPRKRTAPPDIDAIVESARKRGR